VAAAAALSERLFIAIAPSQAMAFFTQLKELLELAAEFTSEEDDAPLTELEGEHPSEDETEDQDGPLDEDDFADDPDDEGAAFDEDDFAPETAGSHPPDEPEAFEQKSDPAGNNLNGDAKSTRHA
jgi:hypothetical protein